MGHFTATLQSEGTLSTNYQNLYTFDNISILFHGFIANVQELCPIPKLDLSLPDSMRYAKAMLTAYRLWGNKLSQNVFGEYAVAIYNASNRSLLLAHDTLGIVPLYYYKNSNGIVFSSHMNGIVNRSSSFQIDEEYIADYLCYGDHYGERTPFTEVKRLTPGISICYSNNTLTINKCWGIKDRHIRYSDTRDYEEHLRSLMQEAVETSLPTNGTTWCELSGGLDSSTVLCTAANLSKAQNLSALSLVYPESHLADEFEWIKPVLEKSGVPSYTLNVDSMKFFTALPTDFYAQPYHAMCNLALYQSYGKLLKENKVDVVLTGMGGDAVLLGDGPEPFFFADLLTKGHLLKLGKQLASWASLSKQRRPALYWLRQCTFTPVIRKLKNQLIQDYLPPHLPWLAANYERGIKRSKLIRKSWVPANNSISIADSWFLERIIRCSNIVSLWDYTYPMTAEFRHPLMYVPLIEFMCSIPWEVRLSPIVDRVLQRAAFKGILPDVITQRETKAGPDQVIYKGLASGAQWLHLLSTKPVLVERGYIDPVQWKQTIELAQLGRCTSIKHFIAAATLEAWLQQLKGPLI